MPVYEYSCKCGAEREVIISLNDLDDTDIKCFCGKSMQRMISQSQGKPVVYEYFSENLNAQITSPKQKKRIMAEQGVAER